MKIPQRNRSKVGFNMTPMIDVVFLLIIFFLVSSHLVRQESRPDLTLAVAPSGEEQAEKRPDLVINVERDGRLFVAGRLMTASSLESVLKKLVSDRGKDLMVQIRASREAIYGNLEPVMLACTRAEVWNVFYAVYRQEPNR